MQPCQATSLPVSPIDPAGDTRWERVKSITEKLEEGIKALFASDQYAQYLKTMSRFHHYSLSNSILIFLQMPQASCVAGYKDWQKKFGRNVRKGEKGIRILAPIVYGKKKENTDESDDEEDIVTAFKFAHVFDITQTDGKDLPSLGIDELTGDVDQYNRLFDAIRSACPVPIEFEEISDGANGYYHLVERRIAIRRGMSQLQNIKTMIHETAHAMLHALDENGKRPASVPDQHGRETQAESIAYVICSHYSLDVSDYSFGYIAGWSSSKELPESKASLDIVRKTSHDLIVAIDNYMKKEVAA